MDLRKYNTPKGYSLIVGVLLFALGLFGFAFRDSFNVPDHYLIASLVLGFWGLMVGVRNREIEK